MRPLWRAFDPIDLQDLLHIPAFVGPEKYKCRVTYGGKIETIEWERYLPRTIQSLRLVEHNSIDYAFKYKNRDALNTLHAQRGHCDDVLIVKNGLITDTSYANVAFSDGTAWYTPEHTLTTRYAAGFFAERRGTYSKRN